MTEPPPREPDDAALVRAVADGSETALGVLYDRYVELIHAVALRVAGDRQLAEEVVQDTFLALWNRAELFDPGMASLATWLRSIARNRTIDRLRAAGRRPLLVAVGDPGEPGTSTSDLDRLATGTAVLGGATRPPVPEDAAVAGDVRRSVAAALAAMPDDERTVVLLAYREGLTQSEIATRLEWPLGTVKTRTRRALARLREVLEPDGSAVAGPRPGRGASG